MLNINKLNTDLNNIELLEEQNNNLQFNSKEELDNYNNNIKIVNLRLMGDKTLLAQTIQLLAYIRHAIRNNLNTNINVQLKNTVANLDFMFDANGMQVPDLVTQENIQIN